MRAGITLVEILLVVALIAVLGGSTTPFLSRFILQTEFDSAGDKVLSSVRKAQAYAMDNKDDAVWGVCLSGQNVRLYRGSCNSPTLSENFFIPASVTISGLNDTTFNLRGEPSAVLSVTITSSLESQSIAVNSAGGTTRN